MPTRDDFGDELQRQLAKASAAGLSYIDVNAGDLHRAIGGYPGPGHRMPVCSSVMDREKREGDETIESPPKGKGASLTIRYRLPR